MSTPTRYCYRHPDRETGLSCSECGRPICYECMTPAPVGLRCPDHAGKPQGVRRVTSAATRATTGVGARRLNRVTLVLIGVNVLVYLVELALGGTVDGTGNWIYQEGVLFAHGTFNGSPGVADGGWWRLILSAFLHYGPLHLGLNMFSLYFAGSILEQVIGPWRYLLLYVASGLAGAAGALYWSPDAGTVGASGAIFGVLGAMLILEWNATGRFGGAAASMIAINLVFNFAYNGAGGNISIGGHIGGLIGGILVTLTYANFGRGHAAYGRIGPRGIAGLVAVAALSVAVAYLKVHGNL